MVGAARAAVATRPAGLCWTALPRSMLSWAAQEPEKGSGSLGTEPRVH